MKIFISWSGEKTKKIANELKLYIGGFFRGDNIEFFFSNDIDKGANWNKEIMNGLEAVDYALIILDNVSSHSHWLIFEAGAIAAKKLENKRIYTIKFENDFEIPEPLKMFQYTQFEKEDFKRFIHSFNKALKENKNKGLDNSFIDYTIDKDWSNLNNKIKRILTTNPTNTEIRNRERKEREDKFWKEIELKSNKLLDNLVENLTRKYDNKLEILSILEESGVSKIFADREQGLEAFIKYIEIENREITIVGSSLRGLLLEQQYDTVRNVLLKKHEQGVIIKFLLTHPLISDLRAKQEGRDFTDIGKEIRRSVEVLTNVWDCNKENIKFYIGTPTCFGIKTSHAMFLNPYPYESVAYDSPCFIVLNKGYIYRNFDKNHFKVWERDRAKKFNADVVFDDIQLEKYAQKIKNILPENV